MKRIPPSQKSREALRRFLEGGLEGEENPTSELIRMATRLILEEALEAKARDLLDRGFYERRQEGTAGSRNGYRQGRMKSSEGAIEFSVPQLRDISQKELTAMKGALDGRSQELERLAVEMYARGCSTRDIEAAFTDEKGAKLLSRTAVSEVTEILWQEYEAFSTRDLSDVKPLYLFLDGIAERLRPGAKREAVLAAWCINEEGKKILLHIAPGTKESTDCCKDFLEDLRRRGLGDPVQVATDGAPGLIRAVEEVFFKSLRQRCLAHKIRNIVQKLPEDVIVAFKQAARAAYQAPSPAMARALRDDLVERYAHDYPSAVACFLDDFEACIAHLQCPPGHRLTIRTTNLLERLFREDRRRVDAAGNMFGERPVLKLMYASLVRASDRWKSMKVGELEIRQLQVLREQLEERYSEATASAVKTKSAGGAKVSRLQQK